MATIERIEACRRQDTVLKFNLKGASRDLECDLVESASRDFPTQPSLGVYRE